MNRCPSCDSSESAMIERMRFDDGQVADRRECSACGEQWMVPAMSTVPADEGEIESIELRDGDGDGDPDRDVDASDDADGVEEWFR
jgi:hypothetical protein